MRDDAAVQFHRRFDGLARVHGHFRPDGVERERDGKQTGYTETVHEPITVEFWQGHLDGVYGVGIVPINDAGMCVWGAIDVDLDKRPDLVQVAKDITRLELPLIPCRSKSGGVHMYLFCSEPVPAMMMRGKLMEWSVALGYSGVEVFPKQISLAGPKDIGNWINIPYFNGDHTVRYAITTDGKHLNVDEFLQLASDLAVTASELDGIGMPTDLSFEGRLVDAPPCLQCIVGRGGPGESNSNKMMFNIGVYLRKRHGENWEQFYDEYNREPFCNPRGHKEMQQLVKSVNRKAYEYTCNESPIAQQCNRQICITRKFGIGGGEDDPGVVFGSLVKVNTSPPTWIWDVDGKRLELTTEQLKDQGRFHTICMEVINKWPRWMKPQSWTNLIRQKLEHVEVVEVPPDARPEGLVWSHLQAYLTGRAQARSRDELLHNKPWTPTSADMDRWPDTTQFGRTYFHMPSFKTFLEQNRVAGINEKKLWLMIREKGGEHHTLNINGKGINVWSVKAFAMQTAPNEVPRIEPEEM